MPTVQERFVRSLVATGRYRSVSEVVRDGIRLLQEAEHRRLLEKWLYAGLDEEESARLPASLREQAMAHVRELLDGARRDVEGGRMVDGAAAMDRLREELELREEE